MKRDLVAYGPVSGKICQKSFRKEAADKESGK